MPPYFQGFQPSSNPSNWNFVPQNYGAYQPNNFFSVNSWGVMPKQGQFPQQFQQYQPQQAQNLPSAMITNSGILGPCPTTNSTWFPDSGASYHVTADQNNICQLGSFEGPD